ncbi:xanthine dehydrogenase family protein molybdopterin-binding subunit [Actinomadura craniellae]|uniref:Xanthine dehydrogenase family protein molybdopterin-binding subunit n=1 Tax=Actinomadura craniellae TaxID=2231787 RepID=A0A365H0S5_9ACTN|nr:molybdopterin cofactor-binding domain-containing protein [Actinomadura craniellae]RAY12682.1 xanthine dehydrogenase family protein molybdopterin-binding subunit [Actinomadura craniellae]
MEHESNEPDEGLRRRHFLGYLVTAPTLAVAVQWTGDPAAADVPSLPQLEEIFDVGDLVKIAASPTAGLVTVQVHEDGTASYALPRAEVGQGITTAIAMLIAEELDLPLDKVKVTLSDARPELLFNQFTGGSTSVRSLYTPVRTAAAVARRRLVETAARAWKVDAAKVTTEAGFVIHGDRRASYGSLAKAAATTNVIPVLVPLKDPAKFTVIGRPANRVDALAAVTGRKTFAMDLDVPNALPTMMRRPPTIDGTVASVRNAAAVTAMPGITDVVVLKHGVAVRGRTFGQCIDALRALDVTWRPGPVAGESDDTVLAKLKKAVPSPAGPPLFSKSIDAEFTFMFASNSPLEPEVAIADVRADRAEIWSSLKVPGDAQNQIAGLLGLPVTAVKVHVVEGGGSFGRRLHTDAAVEAAEISKKIGKPVKLSWSRTDSVRQGRAHPMCVSRIRATYRGGDVLSYEQRHVNVETSFSHGFGDIVTANAAKLPVVGNPIVSQVFFILSQSSPYNFGSTKQTLTEVPLKFKTGSMRNVYSPNLVCARELVVDRLAAAMNKDPVKFRREYLKNGRLRTALDRAAAEGGWGRALPDGVAQGIGLHAEYRAACAVLVELDCRPETVNRPIRHGVAGPRVTRALVVVDAGLPINPRGLEAQMIGGLNDGIAMALTASLHIKDGIPLEGSWDNYFYTRQWNTPPQTRVIVLPPTGDEPGGAGELAVAPSLAAVACAYARATGTMPTRFPLNHSTLGFEPFPLQPSTPQSPTDGLDRAF